MNKKYFIIAISIFIIVAAFLKSDGFGYFKSLTAYAVGDLTVDWGIGTGDVGAIFNVTNMAPGQFQSKTVNISNGASSARSVSIKGILTSDPGVLANVMDIVINDGTTDLYGGSSGAKTLTNFFTDSSGPSGINLFTLSAGQNKNITIKVTFQSSAGNSYQNKTLIFNIQIGIAFDLPADCQNIQFSGPPIFGTSGNDTIRGGNRSQLIIGLEGNDKITGGNAPDCIIGGPGNDTISGGNAKDIIDAGTGNDKVTAGNGDDIVNGDEGNDDINAGNGNDTVSAGPGNDKVDAGTGNDIVDGGTGDDNLKGQNGTDNLTGGLGDDTINGGLGSDTCTGEHLTSCEH